MNIFITLCIAGILSNSIGIAFDLYILNIIGCILTAIGATKLPIEGIFFKKTRNYAYASVPFSILAFMLTFVSVPEAVKLITTIQLCMNTFFYIYFTYYFTEALIGHAQKINELAITRGLRAVWTMCGMIAFLYFIAYSSLIPTIVMIAKAILLIAALYYCFTVYNVSKNLKYTS